MRILGRPFGIVALAVLALAGAAWTFAAVAGFRAGDIYTVNDWAVPPEVMRVVALGWVVMLAVSGVLLLALHRWGWTLLMLATGIGLAAALWQWWIGNLEPVRLAILVATAFYLNGREIRELLLPAPEQPSAVPLASPEGGQR